MSHYSVFHEVHNSICSTGSVTSDAVSRTCQWESYSHGRHLTMVEPHMPDLATVTYLIFKHLPRTIELTQECDNLTRASSLQTPQTIHTEALITSVKAAHKTEVRHVTA
jgi:hypothetical protein